MKKKIKNLMMLKLKLLKKKKASLQIIGQQLKMIKLSKTQMIKKIQKQKF